MQGEDLFVGRQLEGGGLMKGGGLVEFLRYSQSDHTRTCQYGILVFSFFTDVTSKSHSTFQRG